MPSLSVPAGRGPAAPETIRDTAAMETFNHTLFDTRFGPAAIAATGRGVIRLALPAYDPDELVEEVAVDSGLVPSDGGNSASDYGIDDMVGAVDAFLDGKSTGIDLAIDWRLASGFTHRILRATMEIPYGETRSYGEIAIGAGCPRAHRAAGTALSKNPVALVIPCHRVIRSDGKPGAYGRGSEGRKLKRALLALEADRS
jgi:methylated-DNA-[protein]-cysteine S-methyltransferase